MLSKMSAALLLPKLTKNRSQFLVAATLAITAIPLFYSGCADSPQVTAYAPLRGAAQARAYGKQDKLTADVNTALTEVSAAKDETTGIVTVTFRAEPEAREALTGGGKEIGPCVVDGYAYAYYLLRAFDESGQFVAASLSPRRPIPCSKEGMDFSAFDGTPQSVPFQLTTAILRDGRSYEFGVYFDVFVQQGGWKGILFTDQSKVRRFWLERKPPEEPK